MFGKHTEIDMGKVIPTSKMALKLSCLSACGKNINEAQKLYDYFTSDMANLPDVEPSNPTILQQADSILGWIGSHKDDLAQGVAMIQGLRTKSIPTNVPPIPPVK